MMTKDELRTLKGQLLVVAALFGVCIAGAIGMVAKPDFLEGFLKEKYGEQSATMKAQADTIASGTFDAELFAAMSDQERLLLYADWMTREAPSAQTPRLLTQAAPALYIARAERTLVCGSPEQRTRALSFLRLAGHRDAIPVLRKARRWADRRGDRELAAQIARTAGHLLPGPPEAPAVPHKEHER